MAKETFEVEAEWVHVAYAETSQFREVYGFASSQGMVNVEGVRYRPKGKPSKMLLVYMHPASTLQLLPMPRAMAAHGVHVLCAGSRYAKNDNPLIFEKVILDLGAYIRHAKEKWGYEKIVIVGWSGGGSLSLFYQSQAENPTIEKTPAGDPVDIKGAKLIPADAMIFQAAHVSRALLLAEWIDPSVIDENDPDQRDARFDLYSPDCPVRPPYPSDWLAQYRAAQLARVRRITARVQETLEKFKRRGGLELERGFVTHRTMAEPRFLDGRIEPNDRPIGRCYLGEPETVNNGPVGLARFSTLRSWMSQWSIDHSRADGVTCAAQITVPMLMVEHSADDAVPQPDTNLMYQASAASDKTFHCIQGANHYFKGQPEHLASSVDLIQTWSAQRGW